LFRPDHQARHKKTWQYTLHWAAKALFKMFSDGLFEIKTCKHAVASLPETLLMRCSGICLRLPLIFRNLRFMAKKRITRTLLL